jgi:hypothetical protein
MKQKTFEKIGFYAIEKKTDQDRSAFHNPQHAYPENYKPSKIWLDFPVGTARAVMEGDRTAIERLRETAARRGLEGRFQIRVAAGGVGGGKGILAVKHMIASNIISTQGKGFPAILRDFEV